jgi:hypothetical protein
MSNLTTTQSTAPRAATPFVRSPLRATRCECQDCHAHTFLVLRTIGSAKCKVCDSRHLAPVLD